MSTYASFQGRVFLGKRDAAGLPIEVRSPGNVAELKLALKNRRAGALREPDRPAHAGPPDPRLGDSRDAAQRPRHHHVS